MKFKINDRVKVIKNCGGDRGDTIGKIGTIAGFREINLFPIEVKIANNRWIYCKSEELDFEEGGEKYMQKFKVGDKVKHENKEGVIVCYDEKRLNDKGIINFPSEKAIFYDCPICKTSNHFHGCWITSETILISSANENMVTLTKIQQEQLTPEMQALIRVGVLDSAGNVNNSTKLNNMLA